MMIIFPSDIVERLEIDSLFALVRDRCRSAIATEYLEKVNPSAIYDEVNMWLSQTQEMAMILDSSGTLPSRDFYDLRGFLAKMRAEGSFLLGEDFSLLKSQLTLLYDWTQYLKKYQESCPYLVKLTYGFVADKSLIKEIDQIIDDAGHVRDHASPELMAIRQLLIHKEREVRMVINKILKKAVRDKLTDEDSQVTIRSGRLVIPLRSEHKRRINGFVHDESASGHTVFLEPTEALQLNNEVRELQYQEKREIAKILIRLTDLVRLSINDLEKGTRFIGLIDFIHAKALFARQIEAVKPGLSRKPMIKWYNSRHPILWLSHESSGKPTVPLSVELTREENKVLVISGPNAGGKSVALKTIGVIQYMLQCGFLVPVSEASECGLFSKIFLDIGDTQSLENDLSTYSSHLNAMRYFLEKADADSLFLIDEFGAGTEPQFGGAIAEAILGELTRKKSFGVVTTHYQNLKKFAEETRGVVNGGMKYDVAGMQPLFELEVGKPGSSFAFEIAEKIGLDKNILKEAKEQVGDEKVNYETLLNELEKEKRKYEGLTQQLEKETRTLSGLRTDYESLKEMLEEERRMLIRQAKAEARQIVEGANKNIEQAIREIRESAADKERTKMIRKSLSEYKESALAEPAKKKARKTEEFRPGDVVSLEGQDLAGEIMNVKGKQAQVRFGNIISFVDLNKLIRPGAKKQGNEEKTMKGKRSLNRGISLAERMSRFNTELDVKGMRAEEALVRVDEYIDQAILLGVDNVRILHGKGYGILREVIRNHLKQHPLIDKMIDEHVDQGGSGVTLVIFK